MYNKSILLLVVLSSFYKSTEAQEISYSVNLNSGFFSYRGESSTSQTMIYLSPQAWPFIHNSPGRKSGFSYEASLQGQKVTRKKILYSVELGYQYLQSRTNVVTAANSPVSSSFVFATGSSKLSSQFLSLSPQIGYRVSLKKILVDLKAGPEYALTLKRKEKIDATITTTGEKISENPSVPNNSDDLRVRVHTSFLYKQFGINAGYAWGLTSYFPEESFGRPKAYSRFLRLGLSYTFR